MAENIKVAEVYAEFKIKADQLNAELATAKTRISGLERELSRLKDGLGKSHGPTANLAQQLQIASNRAKLFGDSTGGLAEKQKILKNKINELLNKGINPQNQGIQKLMAQYRGLGSESASLGISFGKVAGVVGTVGVAIGVAAFAAGRHLLTLGMNAEEAASKFKTIFGAQANDISRWADAQATAMNRSSRDLQNMAADMMALVSPMAATRQAAIDMSEGAVQAAEDLSSFNNVPVADTLLAIRSGLTGEAEPLKRFGIQLTDAALQEYAFANGIRKKVAEMTTAEKVQLRYNAILGQMGAAQGDAARTSGSLTNTIRGIEAVYRDIATEAGSNMVPGFTTLAQAFRQSLTEGSPLGDLLKKIAGGVGAVAQAAGENWQQALNFEGVARELARLNGTVYSGVDAWSGMQDEQSAAIEVTIRAAGAEANRFNQIQLLIDAYNKKLSLSANLSAREISRLQDRLRSLGQEMERLQQAEIRRLIGGAGDKTNSDQYVARITGASLAQVRAARQQMEREARGASGRGSGGSGAGSQAAQRQKEAEQFMKRIQDYGLSESEVLEAQLSRDMNQLNNFYEWGVIRKEQYIDSLMKLEQRNAEQTFKIQLDSVNKYLGIAGNMFSQLGNLFSQYYTMKTAQLDQDYQAQQASEDAVYEQEVAKINREIQNKQARDKALEKAEAEHKKREAKAQADYEKKKAKLQREAAEKQKYASMLSAIINTAQAVTAALTTKPAPLGIALAAIVGAMGAAQVALIAKTPAMASGGYFSGPALIGEAGREFAFPLDGAQGKAAMAQMADSIMQNVDGKRGASVVSGGGDTYVTIQLADDVWHEKISRATRNRTIIIDKGAVA